MLGQAVCSILLSNQNKKPMETREPNELKGQLSFSKVKILVYNYWLYTSKHTSGLYTLLQISLSFYKDSFKVGLYYIL